MIKLSKSIQNFADMFPSVKKQLNEIEQQETILHSKIASLTKQLKIERQAKADLNLKVSSLVEKNNQQKLEIIKLQKALNHDAKITLSAEQIYHNWQTFIETKRQELMQKHLAHRKDYHDQVNTSQLDEDSTFRYQNLSLYDSTYFNHKSASYLNHDNLLEFQKQQIEQLKADKKYDPNLDNLDYIRQIIADKCLEYNDF